MKSYIFAGKTCENVGFFVWCGDRRGRRRRRTEDLSEELYEEEEDKGARYRDDRG
jgi:hypothetical protein